MRTIVLDVETTGLFSQRADRVIEVGAVALENGVVVAKFDTLIHTGAPISHGAFKVHGISEKMLNGKPAPEDVWPSFHEFAGQSPLVAHNARFDSGFVMRECRLADYDLANPWYCTLRLARIKCSPHGRG